MGIYDRDYYRRDGPSFLGSFTERGTVCKWLIGINVTAFVLQMLSGRPGEADAGRFTEAFSLDAQKVLGGEIWRLLTYAFLHSTSSPSHILWNMLFLFWFGSDVEDLYGPREFLAFYLASAVFGGLIDVLLFLTGWTQPLAFMGPDGIVVRAPQVIGASGAVTAVLLLCAIHYPTRVIYLFFFFPLPIWVFVFFSIGKDFLAFLGRTESGVAVDVHLAGALFAFLYYKLHWRLTRLWPEFRSWRKRRAQPKLRVYHPEEQVPREPVGAAVSLAALDDEQLEARVDAILEKISRTGKESLTENEREVLLKASELMKRRRR